MERRGVAFIEKPIVVDIFRIGGQFLVLKTSKTKNHHYHGLVV